MADLDLLKKTINPHRQTDKNFFLQLLDSDAQFSYESSRISACMQLLKILYINRIKTKIVAAFEKKRSLSSAEERTSETLGEILQLNAEISRLRLAIGRYKPFFEEPYFARMDVVDEKEGYNSYYIGKRGDEGLEIVDWRAPLARKYYQKSLTGFTINDYTYKLILRRALRTGNGKLLDMKNEYLNLSEYLTAEEIGGRDEALIFDPFLKEILNSRKEKKEICDIIETIQEKQYSIITLPERAQFAVQGVAGSGKTMIMLHRLSYILYNNERLKPSDVLVITPSDSFNSFIDELSAVLELEKVRTSTLENYFLRLLSSVGLDIGARIDRFAPVPEGYYDYIYSDRFATDLKAKTAKFFDGAHGMFAAEECRQTVAAVLEAFGRQRAEYEFIKNCSLRVRRCILGEIKEKQGGGLYYTKQMRYLFNCVQDCAEFLGLLQTDKRMDTQAYFYSQLITFLRAVKFIRRYSAKICKTAADDLVKLKADVEKEIQELRRYRTNAGGAETYTYADRIARREQVLEETDGAISRIIRISADFGIVYDFADVLRGESFISALGRCENTGDVARLFYRETVKKAKIKYNVADKALLKSDPFCICLILTTLGYKLTPRYGFVFVDEAQDISSSEYSVLRAVNADAAFNVFGDLKQNITPFRGINGWERAGYPVYNLNTNYRNTGKIVKFVADNLGIDMTCIGEDGDDVARVDSRGATGYLEDKKGLRAVICTENNFRKFVRKSYNIVRETGGISKTKINFMTVYESKGLEFSAVCVADGDMSPNEKYVAYTRALKYLAVIR